MAEQEKKKAGEKKRATKTRLRGKIPISLKTVRGPLDGGTRVRGNKCGKGRNFLSRDHISRTHDKAHHEVS